MLTISTSPGETPGSGAVNDKINSLESKNVADKIDSGNSFRDVMVQVNSPADEVVEEGDAKKDGTKDKSLASEVDEVRQESAIQGIQQPITTEIHSPLSDWMAQWVSTSGPEQSATLAANANGPTSEKSQHEDSAAAPVVMAAELMLRQSKIGTVIASTSNSIPIEGIKNDASQISDITLDFPPSPPWAQQTLGNEKVASLSLDGTLDMGTDINKLSMTTPPLSNDLSSITKSPLSVPVPWLETRVSNQMTLITGAPSALNDQSLTEFALQQGLDQKTVKWLFMNDPNRGQVQAPTSTAPLASAGMGLLMAQTGLKDAIHPSSSMPTDIDLDLTSILSGQWVHWLKSHSNVMGFESSTDSDSHAEAIDTQTTGASVPGLSDRNDTTRSTAGVGAFQAHLAKNTLSGSESGLKELGLARGSVVSGQELADKMSLAIGKRIMEAFEKGDWQIRIHLKPAELGHVEVDLRMRSNALDAQLSASQGITRDLLESGLGRLKESLSQSGMDVASIKVNDGSTSRSGGESTPRQTPTRSEQVENEEGLPNAENPVPALRSSNHDGSLDLMA